MKSNTEKAEMGVLKWFRHMERMNEDSLTKTIQVIQVSEV